jgi:hypothetical protein
MYVCNFNEKSYVHSFLAVIGAEETFKEPRQSGPKGFGSAILVKCWKDSLIEVKCSKCDPHLGGKCEEDLHLRVKSCKDEPNLGVKFCKHDPRLGIKCCKHYPHLRVKNWKDYPHLGIKCCNHDPYWGVGATASFQWRKENLDFVKAVRKKFEILGHEKRHTSWKLDHPM